MRTAAIISMGILLTGCTGKIAVMTLESTITQAAMSAQRATRGASKELSIEVSVTTGLKADTADPVLVVPVVPIDFSFSTSTTTKLKLDVDLEKFEPPADIRAAGPQLFILDTRSGLLSRPVQ